MRSLALLLAVLPAAAVAQADAERGRVLYETFCMTCHYERVHERPPGRTLVKSLADLRAQVERWAPRTRMRFTREDVADVVAYLDRSHYKLAQ